MSFVFDNIIFGVVGASFLLFAFFMNLFNIWSEDNLYYVVFNILASFFLILYSYFLYSVPFMIINFVWLFFSIVKFSEIIIKKH